MKDKSLEELNILKILIYTLSFITLSAALILFLLLPTLRAYKEANLRKNSQSAILSTSKIRLQTSQDKISILKANNNKSLDQFEQEFNLKNFQAFLGNYFEDIQIESLRLDKEEKYLKHKMSIQASINKLNFLYDFIDACVYYDNLIKLTYPIVLRASDNGIRVNFKLKIYSN